jgi:hypothetical protein
VKKALVLLATIVALGGAFWVLRAAANRSSC